MNKKLRKRKIKALMKTAIPLSPSDGNLPTSKREIESMKYVQKGMSEGADLILNFDKMLKDGIGLGIRSISALFDPSGILSWPDLPIAIEDFDENPGLLTGLVLAATAISVIPVVKYGGKPLSMMLKSIPKIKSIIRGSDNLTADAAAEALKRVSDAEKITLKAIVASSKSVEFLTEMLSPIIREGYHYGTHTIGGLGKKRNLNPSEVLSRMRDSGGMVLSTLDRSSDFQATIIPWGSGSAEDIARRMVSSIEHVGEFDHFDKSPDAIRNFAGYLVRSEPTLIIELPGKLNTSWMSSKEFQDSIKSVAKKIDEDWWSKLELDKIEKKHRKGSSITHMLPSEYIVGVIQNGKITKF